MESILIQKLTENFNPTVLEVTNESYKHHVPKGAETHFKVTLVSEKFFGLSRVDRQRNVYNLLAQEFKSGLHALSLNLLTPPEWEAKKNTPFSTPDCAGSKTK